MRKFTRETDDMNEVLADFISYRVSVELKNGLTITGFLIPNPAQWTDGYLIGSYEIEKDDVVSLIDND